MSFIERDNRVYVQDTIVPLEDGVRFLKNTEDVRLDEITRIVKQIELIKEALNEVKIQRSNYIREHNLLDGEDPDVVTPRVIITDITLKNPEQAVSYLDNKTLYIKNPANLPVESAKESIMEPVKYVDLKLRDFDFLIRKLSFKESQLLNRLKRLEAWEISSNNKKRINVEIYNDLKDELFFLTDILNLTSDLINFLENFADDFDYDKKKDRAGIIMADISFSYNTRRKNLIQKIKEFEERFENGLVSFNEELTGFLPTLEELFPKQYTDAYNIRSTLIEVLKGFLPYLVDGKKDILKEINALVEEGDIKNPRVIRLLKRAKSYIQSRVTESVVDKQTTPEVAKQNFIRRYSFIENRTKEFKELLKKAANFSTIPDELREKYKFDLIGTLILKRSFSDQAKTGANFTEDYWRDKVRKEYGGNIRFCDEVETGDGNGNIRYIKQEDAVEVRPGVYKSRKELNILDKEAEELKKESDLY